MKRFLYGLLAFLFLFLSIYPFSNVFADDLIITGTPIPVQGDITDDQLTDILVSGITADLISQGYQIDLSAADGDWDNFKNAILDIVFDSASDGTGFIGEIYNSALYHNIFGDDLTIWYPDTSDDTILPGISKRSIYRNLSDGLISDLTDRRSDNSNPTPTPVPIPTDISQYIDIINGSGFWWRDWPNKNYYNANQLGMLSNSYPPSSVSWVSNYNDYSYLFTPAATRDQYCIVCDIQNIYITSQNNVYYVNYTILNSRQAFLYNNNPGYNGIVSKNQRFTLNTVGTNPDGSIMQYSGTLVQVFSWLSYRFRNVNIYVDGIPWSIIGDDPQVLPTVIINPGYVLQGTNYPLVFKFPEPPYFDYQRMIDIIKHALLQYGVIQWEDIADVFVDVNGQTAVAILEIHRNDYDVLYDEQYPGIALPNKFNTHLLDTSHQYLSPLVQTVEETTGILPGEIKGALAIGMMLTIFACLIHRLLE